MEAGSTPPSPGQSSRRGLLWAIIVAVLVVAAITIAAVLFLWPREEERVTVPDVVGLSAEDAERVLMAAGLAIGETEHVSVDADADEVDTVLSQLPAAGDEVDAGSEVALVMAEAEEEATETPPASGGGSRAGPTPDPTPSTTTIMSYRRSAVLSGHGRGDHQSGTFTTTGSSLFLTVTLSTSSGASMFHFELLNSAGGVSHSLTISATPTSTTHTREWSQPPGSYSLHILAPESLGWRFTLDEIIAEEVEVRIESPDR